MTLIELIDNIYIENNKTITRKKTGEIVAYKDLVDTERTTWRYALINQIKKRLELLFDLPEYVPGLPAEQLQKFQMKTVLPYEEAKIRLLLLYPMISKKYKIAMKKNKNIMFSQWAEEIFGDLNIYKEIIKFRDSFCSNYNYDLATNSDPPKSRLLYVSYDYKFLDQISEWLETTAFVLLEDSNTLVRKYMLKDNVDDEDEEDKKRKKRKEFQEMCNTLCEKDATYRDWYNILMSILFMYNNKINETHISNYEYKLPLSKRLQSMTEVDERFIRSLLTYITDHAEYEGRSIRVFKELKKGHWEYLPFQNRMELYNCIEALAENNDIYKYMLFDSDEDTEQHILRLTIKLLEPEYYRICLKMDLMKNCLYGKQCQSRETAGEVIREYERRIDEVYDYFLKNIEWSLDQAEENLRAQLLLAGMAKKNNAMEQPDN